MSALAARTDKCTWPFCHPDRDLTPAQYDQDNVAPFAWKRRVSTLVRTCTNCCCPIWFVFCRSSRTLCPHPRGALGRVLRRIASLANTRKVTSFTKKSVATMNNLSMRVLMWVILKLCYYKNNTNFSLKDSVTVFVLEFCYRKQFAN